EAGGRARGLGLRGGLGPGSRAGLLRAAIHLLGLGLGLLGLRLPSLRGLGLAGWRAGLLLRAALLRLGLLSGALGVRGLRLGRGGLVARGRPAPSRTGRPLCLGGLLLGARVGA